MKRHGFCIASTLIFVLISSLIGGIMIIRTTEQVKAASNVAIRSWASVGASICGIKIAEDWLMSSIISKDIPRLSMLGREDPMDRIEALRADGSAARHDLGDRIDVRLYVADADYESGLFRDASGNLSSSKTPSIPRIPIVSTAEGFRLCYYLRSSAESGDGRTRIVCEEMISVTFDLMERVTDVRRLFYRSSAEADKAY
jgi:hypothetical protein